jgi:hypothetical protein
MKHLSHWIVVVLVTALVPLTGCSATPAAEQKIEHPAEVKDIPGSTIKTVILAEQAAQRIDVKTEQVRDAGGQHSVPYSSLIYDPAGKTWVYTSPSPRTFVRHEIEVDRIDGDQVFFKGDPATGTLVASRAVAELYGIEFKVGH